MIVAAIQARYDVCGAIAAWLARLPIDGWHPSPDAARPLSPSSVLGLSVCCQALHLPCDMVVSGGNGLSHWLVQPWWPFSTAGYVYPMIPWGDPGPTVILMGGLIATALCMNRTKTLSLLSLVGVLLYLVVRRAWTAA